MRLGDQAPNFVSKATGYSELLDFYNWAGNSWVILFSHPADFTPVCTTELGQVAKLKDLFEQYNTKVIGLSVDNIEDHLLWSQDILETQGYPINFPIVADEDRSVSRAYGMLDQISNDPTNFTETGLPLTVRSVFIIDPKKKIRLILTYPAAVGRNFDEIFRSLIALQLGDAHKIATPANWTPGSDVIVRFDVSDEEAKERFEIVSSPKPYLRFCKCPMMPNSV